MPMEYFIEELRGKSKVQHGSTFNFNEAQRKANSVQVRTGNPVNVTPQWVPVNQVESGGEFEIMPITAQELYEEVHGTGANLGEQSYRTRLLYQVLSEKTNEVLEDYQSGVIFAGAVEEGVS